MANPETAHPDAGISIGEVLRALRRGGDLSQRQLADRAGVPPSTVGRLESPSGMDARLRTVERVRDAFGAPGGD